MKAEILEGEAGAQEKGWGCGAPKAAVMERL